MSEKITVFDIEILNRDPSSICSIGIVVLEDMKIVDTYYSLIKPKNLSYDKVRYGIHHIRADMLKREKSFKEVWKEIEKYFDNTYVVSHGIQVDMAAIRDALYKNDIEYPTLKMSCTHVLSQAINPNLEHYNISSLCKYYNIEELRAHHALDDALICAYILQNLCKQTSLKTLEDIHNHYHIPFGEMRNDYYHNLVSADLVNDIKIKKHPMTNMSVAFTGVLNFNKETLHNQLDQIHAFYNKDVNTHTDLLVIGRHGFKKERYSGKNRKVKKALSLMKKGQDLKIIHEKEYIRMLKK